MDGLCLPVFQYTAAVDYIQQPVQTGSAQHLMQEFPYQSLLKVKYEQLLTFVPLCYYKVHVFRVNRCVQNKMALKCAKNHANLFWHFEDKSSRT